MNLSLDLFNQKHHEDLWEKIEQKNYIQIENFWKGVHFYRNHPFVPFQQEKKIIHTLYGAILSVYGVEGGKPIFIIPSLINNASILDLYEDVSLIHYLAKNGFQVFCLDWGEPDKTHIDFELVDYFEKILIFFLHEINQISNQKPIVMGYCMGGIFALLAGQFAPDYIEKIVLLAPPFDFHVPNLEYDSKLLEVWLEQSLKADNHIPKECIPYVFFIKNPFRIIQKYASFGPSCSDDRQKLFVSIEDWLNDPIALARKVGIEVIDQWFLRNAIKNQEWTLGGIKVNLSLIKTKVLLVSPLKDSVIPQNSNLGLTSILPNVILSTPNLGHVGIVASSKAKETFWPSLVSFMQ